MCTLASLLSLSLAQLTSIKSSQSELLLSSSHRRRRLRLHLLKLRQPHRCWNHHLLCPLDLFHYHFTLPLGALATFVEQHRNDNHQACEAADPPGPTKRDDGGRDDGVQDGQGQQQLPAEAHQAVVANARQRSAQPDEQEEEDSYLDQVDQDGQARDAFQAKAKEAPATKEQRRRHRADSNHIDVLRHLVEAPTQSAVLGQIAGSQFLLGLGQIEWSAIDLGDPGDQVEAEAQWLRGDKPYALVQLRLHNANHTQRSSPHQRAAQGESQAGLIGDHLRRAAQRTQQRVAVAGCPAAQYDAIDRQRGNGEYPQQSDIDVTDDRVPDARLAIYPAIADGDDGESAQRDHHRNDGRDQVNGFFSLRWHDLLFEGHFERVGHRLEHASRASAVWPQAALHLCHHAPLDQCHIGESRKQRENHDCAFDNARDNWIIDKLKHVPPLALASVFPALPGLPRSVQRRMDS